VHYSYAYLSNAITYLQQQQKNICTHLLILLCLFADDDQGKLRVNSGTHVLPLYCAPVPDVHIMIADSLLPQCGYASVKLRISHGIPRPASVTTSEESDSDTDATADARVGEVRAACCVAMITDSLPTNKRPK